MITKETYKLLVDYLKLNKVKPVNINGDSYYYWIKKEGKYLMPTDSDGKCKLVK